MRSTKEQRRHLRIQVILPVEIVDRDGNVLGASETLNLSRRGLLIRRPEEPVLAVGDEPYISIDLPTEHSRWEEEDTISHYSIHTRVTRVTAETVALHLKQDQFIFILAPER
jgi:hypothetical protein